ncbi:MAG TPA: universal stress protein [Methylomirabilota bacterium]|nr:universal stress protein [Methylomirabilota bacterium]
MFQRILCATDFSETAEAAWQVARDLAHTHRAELILVHVFAEFPVYPEVAGSEVARIWEEQRGWVERALADRVAAAALPARWMLKAGAAAESIIEAATESQADLIVIGTLGLRGLTRLFIGSVADSVVRLAPFAVLTVKPREAERAAAPKAA